MTSSPSEEALLALKPRLQIRTVLFPSKHCPDGVYEKTLLEEPGQRGSPASCLFHVLGFPSVLFCLLRLSVSCEVLVGIN